MILSSCINTKFKELINEIEYTANINGGENANPRGLEVKEALITGFAIDPNYPCVDFNAREFNWKYFAGELAWYLLRTNETEFIDKFSNFWAKLKNEDGTVNSNYGKLLLSGRPGSSYTQSSWIVESLKRDMYSRQAIGYIGDKQFQYDGNKDFVCTQYVIFFIRNNELHMKVQMRSNDIFYGLTYDAPWFSTFHQNIYQELLETYPQLKLGQYFHFSDNTHYYKRHFEMATEILNEEQNAGPKLKLKKPLWTSSPNGTTLLTSEAADYLKWFDDRYTKLEELTYEDYKEALSLIFEIN